MKRDLRSIPLYVLFALILVGAVSYGIWTQAEAMREASARVQELEVEIVQAEARLVRLQQLKAQAEQMEADDEQLRSLLPELPLEDDLIIKIQSVADLSDMRLMFIRFDERSDGSGLQEMPIKIGMQGTFHQLVEALGHLTGLERAIRVEELSMMPLDEDTTVLSVVLSAAAFVRQ